MQIDELLTREEASKVLKRSMPSMDRDRMLGEGVPYVRVGRNSVRYRRSDIERYLERNTVQTSNQLTAA